MKQKVSELDGALLDAAVAKALGAELRWCLEAGGFWQARGGEHQLAVLANWWAVRQFSADWMWGGPIIERERIEWVIETKGRSHQWQVRTANGAWFFGPTPLIAAMRAFVASKLGDEVEL